MPHQCYKSRVVIWTAIIFALNWATARGQVEVTAPLAGEQRSYVLLAGPASNTGPVAAPVYSTIIESPGALWLRLRFVDVSLSGDPANGTESYLRITSMLDGAVQTLNAAHVAEWRRSSAYFNGNAVFLEIIAHPGTGDNFLSMSELTAGVEPFEPRSICDGVDDRQLSNDPRQCRAVPVGCTAWLFDDPARTFLTAGHCASGGNLDVMEFNVPLSDGNGNLVHPPPSDQYAVDPMSVQFTSGGVGQDWCYFGCFANTVTGFTPFQAQGANYVLADTPPVVNGQMIRITGYGTTSSPVSNSWNQVQKTHLGTYRTFTGTRLDYRTDTTGGNSGSPVVDEGQNVAIGIHTHGGCGSGGSGANSGTGCNHPGLLNALANPLGVCAQGVVPPNNPTAASNPCGPVTLTRSGSPPVGQVWYWQGTACGQRTDLGSGATFTALATGTYFLRGYSPDVDLWSTSCGSVTVTVNLGCVQVFGNVRTALNEAMPNVTVTANNGGGSGTTDINGSYSLIVPMGWSGALTPALPLYSFSPQQRSHANVTSDLLAQDFLIVPTMDCNTNHRPDSLDVVAVSGNLVIDSPALSMNLPDNNTTGISHTLSVPRSGMVQDLNITAHVAHTRVSDLIVYLSHGPASTTLWSRRCSSADNLDVTFDDAGVFVNCANLAGIYRPNTMGGQNLSAYNGLDALGDWTLRVADVATGETGVLTGWRLNVVIPDLPAVSQDANLNGVPDECECPCGGDMNASGSVDGDDMQLFVSALLGAYSQCADMNGNGENNGVDVALFAQRLMAETACP